MLSFEGFDPLFFWGTGGLGIWDLALWPNCGLAIWGSGDLPRGALWLSAGLGVWGILGLFFGGVWGSGGPEVCMCGLSSSVVFGCLGVKFFMFLMVLMF